MIVTQPASADGASQYCTPPGEAHGLVRPSFVPDAQTQELRGLTRTRTQLVREHTRHAQRVHKVLEDANLKLATVLPDVFGSAGRTILAALVAGETDPARLAALVTTRVKIPQAALAEALHGTVTDYQRFELRLHLELMTQLDRAIAEVEERITHALAPFRLVVERLTTIPGISTTTAHILLAEIGRDMTRFATAGPLVSWAGLCPRLDESASKRRSVRVRKGGRWLKTALVQAAWAAIKVKESYVQAHYVRLKARPQESHHRGGRLDARGRLPHAARRDRLPRLGGHYFDRRDKRRIATRLVRRLTQLGYAVQLHPAA